MRNTIKYLAICLSLALAACMTSGPQKTMDNLADALEKNNPQQFMQSMDMPAFTDNYLTSLTESSEALNSLNSLGNILGLGSLDKLLGSIVDFQGQLGRKLERGVASGELAAQCRNTDTLNCPWVPQSLRQAQIIEINGNAAIAKITTPQQLTSWIALRREGENWLVTGIAVLESEARKFAIGKSAPQGSQNSKPDAKNNDKEPAVTNI